MTLDTTTALAHLPPGLREEVVKEFQKITRNYREGRWEATELDGGRFSEVAYTVLSGYLDNGNYADVPSKPAQFDKACVQLGQADKNKYPKSARVTIPRVLVSLYDIRSNRGVGHVGGDVDANHMDAAYVLHSAQWVMAEFVRIFHATDVQTATGVVDALIDRAIPLIWNVGEVARILNCDLTLGASTLLLLYSSPVPLVDKSLAKNLEQDRFSNYKRVLAELHRNRVIEYDRSTGLVIISPKGVAIAEDLISNESIDWK